MVCRHRPEILNHYALYNQWESESTYFHHHDDKNENQRLIVRSSVHSSACRQGYENEGEMQNVGDSVVEKLHDNNSLDWQFMDSMEDAVSSVEAGDMYAAIIIPKDFTASMYNVFSKKLKRPKLILYQNQTINS